MRNKPACTKSQPGRSASRAFHPGRGSNVPTHAHNAATWPRVTRPRVFRSPTEDAVSKHRYYRFDEDLTVEDLWALDMCAEPDQTTLYMDLKVGKPLRKWDLVRLRIVGGRQDVDVTFTVLGLPVLSERAMEVFADVAPDDIQFLPALIESAGGLYHVMNVVRRLDCLDERRTTFGDVPGFRPVLTPVLDPKKIGGEKVFRLRASPVHIIVADSVRRAIDGAGLTGASLAPVADADADSLAC